MAFLATPEAKGLVNEAYGPAPFAGQSRKLVKVDWTPLGRAPTAITPVFSEACSFGARAATHDSSFIATLHIFVQGTKTVPELMENRGMVIAVTAGKDGAPDSTRPIVPSVAEGFYGKHFDEIPIALIDTDGRLQKIDLRNGSIIHLSPRNRAATLHTAEAAPENPAVTP